MFWNRSSYKKRIRKNFHNMDKSIVKAWNKKNSTTWKKVILKPRPLKGYKIKKYRSNYDAIA